MFLFFIIKIIQDFKKLLIFFKNLNIGKCSWNHKKNRVLKMFMILKNGRILQKCSWILTKLSEFKKIFTKFSKCPQKNLLWILKKFHWCKKYSLNQKMVIDSKNVRQFKKNHVNSLKFSLIKKCLSINKNVQNFEKLSSKVNFFVILWIQNILTN